MRCEEDATARPSANSITHHPAQSQSLFADTFPTDRASMLTANFAPCSEQAPEDRLATLWLPDTTGRFICDSSGRELGVLTGNIVLFEGARLSWHAEAPDQKLTNRNQAVWSCPT